jgi:hypothetical protein
MKINLGTQLLDLRGQTIREDMRVQLVTAYLADLLPELSEEKQKQVVKAIEEFQKPLTLWTALVQMTGANIEGLTPEETGKVFITVAGMAANKNGVAELDASAVTLLQKAIGKVYKSPIIAGQLHALLDGKNPFPEVNASGVPSDGAVA